MKHILPSLTLLGCLTACASAPTPKPAATPTPSASASRPSGGADSAHGDTPRRPGSDSAGAKAGAQPRPYNRVITADAKTSVGLFKTHLIGEKLYFEIPRAEFDRNQLLLQANEGANAGGDRIVRWRRVGNKVYLEQYSYSVVADSTQAIAKAVNIMDRGPLIASFPVESWGPDSAAVIEVTKLYTTAIPEFVASGLSGPVADRTMIDRAVAYPDNVEIDATQTGTAQSNGPGGRSGTTTLRPHWSLLRLPTQPMMPRLFDKRVSYITSNVVDYGRPDHKSVTRTFIHRFRLEKKDPTADLSDPVTPIVFWIDPATPTWLVPWVKKGIEDWRPAYEVAGFRNAIVGREAPSASEDPNWSMADARHSMIYWRPSTTENANGGQIVDPRSGEIIKAQVQIYHNVMNLVRNWYFVQASPLDPRAQSLPLPDSLMGRLVEYVVAHEVGHAVGFEHNMKASSEYPADSVRSPTFLRRMGGHVATLMDYSRFNYVAQPEDHVPVDLLVPEVGPYDKFAVMWGHKPIPGARTPDEEKATLDQWARMQDSVPWYRWQTSGASDDPGDLTEAVGDADAVKSNTLGMKNLERVMKLLRPVAEKPGEDYSLLNELYGQVISQWGRYMEHVAAIVGGAQSQERYGTGPRFTPETKQRQHGAVQFLTQYAFHTPAYFIDVDILRRIQQDGVLARVHTVQVGVLNSLLNTSRLNRLTEYEALAPKSTDLYTVGDLMADVRHGVWSELSAPHVRIDVYRRSLQRAYLEIAGQQVNPPAAAGPGGRASQADASDARAYLRGELVELNALVGTALTRTSDSATRLHLQDVHLQITRMLDPEKKG